MFSDIVGYSSLMGSDENLAFKLLRKNREIHKQLIKKFNGELIKEMGDGMLVSFQLASYAVRCAQAIQFEAIKNHIPLKIGIHEGEMVFEEGDVFGDGVNIASRLQESTKEGCISISGVVYNDVKNKKDIYTEYIGEETFKNVADPIKVYKTSCDEKSIREFIPEKLEKKDDRREPFYTKPIFKYGSVSTTVIALVIFLLFYGGTSLPFEERDWIVITDFENLTEESIFDHSLNTAFSLSVSQSRHINVIARQRLIDALKRMKRDDIEYIDEETGREIAIREGVKICIIPSISRVGMQYILTANIQEAETGEILRAEVLYAESQNKIINKLDQLSKRIRRNLGESNYKILQQSKPLEKVTTSSLDALKEYSLGREKRINLQVDEAITHYKNAIRIDSNFTAAKASLGNVLLEMFGREEGIKWMNEAILSINDLTEGEKYRILASYAVNVENDLDKGVEYTKTLLELYPDDPVPHNSLGYYFQKQGYYEKAVEECKTALRIDPYYMQSYANLIWTYLSYLGNMDSAITWSNRMIKVSPENAWGYNYLGSAYVGKGDLEKAEAEFLKGKNINSDILWDWGLYRLSHVYQLQGKYESAIDVLEEILKKNPEEYPAHQVLGIYYNLMGKNEIARNHFLEYKKIAKTWFDDDPDDPNSFIFYGIALTYLGEKKAGWEIGKRALELDSTVHFNFSKLLAVQGRKDEALDHLEKALENGFRDLVWLKLDPDLLALHKEERFEELINEYFDI
jgi:tetratricopeptide (TPR) repeat protein